MRALNYGFDQINTEQIVKRIYNLVSPLDGFSPVSSSVYGRNGAALQRDHAPAFTPTR